MLVTFTMYVSTGYSSTKTSHTRQRSADRDANDILPGGRKMQTSYAPLMHNTKPHRSVTPAPRSTQKHFSAPTRRAITPSAELGRDGKPAIVHFRQPSYLIAVDGEEDDIACTCDATHADTYRDTSRTDSEPNYGYDSCDGPRQQPVTNQVAQWRCENGIELLRSLPPEGPAVNGSYRSPAASHAVPSNQERFHNHMAVNEAIHSRVTEFVHTPSPCSGSHPIHHRHGSSGLSSNIVEQSPRKCLFPTNNACPDYRAQDVVDHRQQSLRRSGSLEEVDLPPDGVVYSKAGARHMRPRPQSARPFDYQNNSRPSVKHPMGETTYDPGEKSRAMNKMAAWMSSSDSDAGDDVYINSKAVQSILNYQKVQQQAAQQAGRAAPSSRTTQQAGTAAPSSRTTQQAGTAAPSSRTTQQAGRAAPPSCTTQQAGRAAPPSCTTQQAGRAAPPSCTTQQAGRAAPHSRTTQPRAPLSGTASSANRSLQTPTVNGHQDRVTRTTKVHPTQTHHRDFNDKTLYISHRPSGCSGDRNSSSSAGSNGSSIPSLGSTDSCRNTRHTAASQHGASTENDSSVRSCSNSSAALTTKQRLLNIPESLMDSPKPGMSK